MLLIILETFVKVRSIYFGFFADDNLCDLILLMETFERNGFNEDFCKLGSVSFAFFHVKNACEGLEWP